MRILVQKYNPGHQLFSAIQHNWSFHIPCQNTSHFTPRTLYVFLLVWTPWPCGWENYWEAVWWHAAGLQWGTVQEVDRHAEAAQEALQRGEGTYLCLEEGKKNEPREHMMWWTKEGSWIFKSTLEDWGRFGDHHHTIRVKTRRMIEIIPIESKI